MPKTPEGEAEFVLKLALQGCSADNLSATHWPDETDRWRELVFALVLTASDVPPMKARIASVNLLELGLLDVSKLASMCSPNGVDRTTAHASRVALVLQEVGLTDVEADIAIELMATTASNLEQRFQGKLQRFLRGQAERFVSEALENLVPKGTNAADMRRAVVLWLQNVANLPLSLVTKEMESVCYHHGITPDELLKTADHLNVNWAIVDDVMKVYASKIGLLSPSEE